MACTDPVLLDDWHPVARAQDVEGPTLQHAALLDHELLLWRDDEGALHAWEDRCPHRGTRLSIGQREAGGVTCAYHGWRFGADAHCAHIPAQPQGPIPSQARVREYHVAEHYGLVWVCLGQAEREVPPFPEHAHEQLRKVVCGPYDVAASSPRIVENFLDMAHFGFVHEGILGDAQHTSVQDYRVQPFDGVTPPGVLATQCMAWQPRSNSLAETGSMVEYTYRVVRPLTAILTKQPEAFADFREAISLHVQPVSEESSRAWIILALTNFEQEEGVLRAFQDRIFLQDKPIVENQVPKRLPLDPGLSIPCDRMSLAYRRYLASLGLRYSVVGHALP